jgi:hypothetical protein
LIAAAHPGYWWPLAGALGFGSLLVLCDREYTFLRRTGVVAALAAVAIVAAAPQVPDILREVDAAGDALPQMIRLADGPQGNVLLANVLPLWIEDDRAPCTHLLVALAALTIGWKARGAPLRRTIIGAALVSIAFGIAASIWVPGRSLWVPSVTWGLRDPAIAFAVLSGAGAAATLRGMPRQPGRRHVVAIVIVGLIGALQGPVYAVSLAIAKVRQPGNAAPWNWNPQDPWARMTQRKVPLERMPPGERLALWPGVREQMRHFGFASTDFVRAGYTVLTAWTKQRTMVRVVQPNTLLFNQSTDLTAETLCDPAAIQFLRLRYLFIPEGVAVCEPWHRLSDVLVDGYWQVGVVPAGSQAVHAIDVAQLSREMAGTPAFSAGSSLLAAVRPIGGTSLTLDRRLIVRTGDVSSLDGKAVVLPLAYDSAWRSSSGSVRSIGGLLAVTGIDRPETTLEFQADGPPRLRAFANLLAQVIGVLSVAGIAARLPGRAS